MRYSDEVVNKLKNLDTLPKSNVLHNYCLTHYYDQKPRRFYVQAPYAPDVFDAICAYIQFECSEIEETYGMDQTDVINILENFYDCKKCKRTRSNQVDLYYNWELFCGSGLQEVECLKRDGMNAYFQKYIDNFYEMQNSRKESVN